MADASGPGRPGRSRTDRRTALLLGGTAALGISALTLPTAAAHASPGTTGGGTAYTVGAAGPAGGLIFLTPDAAGGDGTHYYEAAPTDASATASNWILVGSNPWANVATAIGKAVGDGAPNTAAMLAAGDVGGAAHLAGTYTRSHLGSDFDDWFAPSFDEIALLWTNLGATAGLDPAREYWTSTAEAASSNWAHLLLSASGGRTVGRLTKGSTAMTRPVRRFAA